MGEAEEAETGKREDIRICKYLNLKLPFISEMKRDTDRQTDGQTDK